MINRSFPQVFSAEELSYYDTTRTIYRDDSLASQSRIRAGLL